MNKKKTVYMLCNYPQDYRKLGGQTFVFQFLSSPFFLLRPTQNIFLSGRYTRHLMQPKAVLFIHFMKEKAQVSLRN